MTSTPGASGAVGGRRAAGRARQVCRRTFYCGKVCLTADWKREGGHKAGCKALIAEGKGAAAAPCTEYLDL